MIPKNENRLSGKITLDQKDQTPGRSQVVLQEVARRARPLHGEIASIDPMCKRV